MTDPDTVTRCILMGRLVNGEQEIMFSSDEHGIHPHLDGYLIAALDRVPVRALRLLMPGDRQHWSRWDWMVYRLKRLLPDGRGTHD